MDILPKIRIPLCIEQGSVFNFKLQVEGVGRESKNRYFVVLNKNPKTDTALIMITSTTQIEKKKEFARHAGISEETIIVVSPAEYPVFKSESAFNCNDVYEVPLSDLIRKVEENGSMNYPKMPKIVLNKIIKAVHASPRVTEVMKRLV